MEKGICVKKCFFKTFFIIFCLGITNISSAPRASIEWYDCFCWLNSSVQCLFKLKPLTEFLKDKKPNEITVPSDIKGTIVLREYVKLLQKVIEENKKSETIELKRNDTETFYLAVREWLGLGSGYQSPFLAMNPPIPFVCKTDFCLGKPLLSSSSSSVCSRHLRGNCTRDDCLMGAFGSLIFKSFYHDYKKIFGYHSYVKETMACQRCKRNYVEYQCDFSIFKRFMRENLPSFSTKKCSTCGSEAAFTRRFFLKSLPEVVKVYSFQGFDPKTKITIDKSFLSPDISEEERNRLEYDLSGFIVQVPNHHIWAYTKDYDTGIWYHNDGLGRKALDKEVSIGDIEKCFKDYPLGSSGNKTFISNLFYIRVGEPAAESESEMLILKDLSFEKYSFVNSLNRCFFAIKPLMNLLESKEPRDVTDGFFQDYVKYLKDVKSRTSKRLKEEEIKKFYDSLKTDYFRKRIEEGENFLKDFVRSVFPNDYKKIFDWEDVHFKTYEKCESCNTEKNHFLTAKKHEVMRPSSFYTGENCTQCSGKMKFHTEGTFNSFPEVIGLFGGASDFSPIEVEIDKNFLSSNLSKKQRGRLKYNLCGFIVYNRKEKRYWSCTKDDDTASWHYNDWETIGKDVVITQDEAKEEFEKHAFSSERSNAREPVTVISFYSRAEKSKDLLSKKVVQLEQSIEGLSQKLNDLKESLSDIAKKVS